MTNTDSPRRMRCIWCNEPFEQKGQLILCPCCVAEHEMTHD